MVKAATRGHLRPLGKSGHLRPLEWLRVAASGCFLWDWNTSATRRRRPLAVSCGHSTERPLAATQEKRPLAATRVAASGCKWLLFMRLKHLGHASKAATCGHLRPLDRAATCGHLRPLEWLRVAASGCFSEIQIPRRMQPQCEISKRKNQVTYPRWLSPPFPWASRPSAPWECVGSVACAEW